MIKTTIAIIGGGACGVAAFIELTLKLKVYEYHQQIKIIIIEKDEEIGQGLAYGTKQPGHILNTPADLMGIYAFEPTHFSDWLQGHQKAMQQEITGGGDMDKAHTTRKLYGDYLQEQFYSFYKIALAEKIEVELIHDEVENINKKSRQWQVLLKSRSSLFTDYLILAPGTPKPNNYPELEAKPGYIDFPWPSEPILKIPTYAAVGILGSSLSAIDTILTLVDNQHNGNITLFSPDGLLPRVQPEGDDHYKRKFLTLENIHKLKRKNLRRPKIKELFDLFKQEAERYENRAIDWKKTGRIGKPPRELLHMDIGIAEAGGDAFTNILYSLRHEASTIWGWLSVAEKQKFMRWLGLYWNINRHAMPLVNACCLMELFDSGQLEVKSGIKEVKYRQEDENFIIKYDGNLQDTVQYLINATGPADHIHKMKSTLIQNLTAQGLIEEFKAGGIFIDPKNMQVISSKAETENFYAVGHLCNGVLLDVNAVWFNVKTIESMCGDIVQKICNAAS